MDAIDGRQGRCQECKCVRVCGFIDNRRSGWNKSATVRKSHITRDFELDRLALEDMSVVMYMPKGFRPFPSSIIQQTEETVVK